MGGGGGARAARCVVLKALLSGVVQFFLSVSEACIPKHCNLLVTLRSA